mmetsp:Transcript_4572/g.5495  ORF Transcript_4572/g.5495 Transcript_4572/m.5495 type:complete len:163 (-) Transcript_4572:186-674(-)
MFLHPNTYDSYRIKLLWINFLINFLLIASIMLQYKLWIKFKIANGEMLIGATLCDTHMFTPMMLEIAAIMVSPYPWFYKEEYEELLNHTVRTFFYVNTPLFTWMIIIRSYHLLQFIVYSSWFMSSRSGRTCRLFGAKLDFLYVLKCDFNERPFYLLLVSLVY